jgi:hypothetical protein
MRENSRRDGCVVLYADGDDRDRAVVEPIIAGFRGMNGSLRCSSCGAALRDWSWRQTDEGAEILCRSCHYVHGVITLSAKVHHG